MNIQFFCKIVITASILLTGINKNVAQAQPTKNIYTCINEKGIPTTVVDTKRGRIRLVVWESDYFRGSGWTPQKRCEEVTSRFQKFSDNGTLKQITTGKTVLANQKIYNIICVAATNKPGMQGQCLQDGLLLILESGDNPKEVLNNLFQAARDVNLPAIKRGDSFDLVGYLEVAPLMEKISNNVEIRNNPDNVSPKPLPSQPTIENCPAILCD